MIRNPVRRTTASKTGWAAALLAVAMMSTGTAGVALAAPADGVSAGAGHSVSVASADRVSVAAIHEVKAYGAKGDGKANDVPAINRAITAANKDGGGVVHFPSGTYMAGATIRMLSNVTLQLDASATIRATGRGYDKAEPNPNSKYQDYGHSHFNNAVIRGDRVQNIGFVGPGTIDGGGKLEQGESTEDGQADKLISLTNCDGLRIDNITLKRGGHFAIINNGCNNITSDRLTIRTADERDGWNVISAQNVTITNADIASSDDALAFKSDYALGKKFQNRNVRVTNSVLSSSCCNALMFGSETCGDFSDFYFSNIKVTLAAKAGLGLVSMDGAKFSNINYTDITIENAATAISLKVGTRKRCGNKPGVGDITNVNFKNITASNRRNIKGRGGPWPATIWGQPDHPVKDVTFDNVHIEGVGGSGAMDPTKVPSDNGNYNPRGIGKRPAYGIYLHRVSGITFKNSSVRFRSNDRRPGLIVNSGDKFTIDGFTAQTGSGAPFDLGIQKINGYCLRNTGALRVGATGSTQNCAT